MGFSSRNKSSSTSSSKHAKTTALLERLERTSNQPENKKCADCGEKNPKWASILSPPVSSSTSSGRKMGVFCCYKCCSYHFQLGRDVCVVKNLKTSEDWTEKEVRIMETSGNEISNAIYEGLLTESKRAELPKSGEDDQEAFAEFVTAKYKKLYYFCKKTYDSHGSWFSSFSSKDATNNATTHRRTFQEEIMREVNEEAEPTESTTTVPSSVDLGYGDDDDIDLGYGPTNLDLGYGSTEDIDEDEELVVPVEEEDGEESLANTLASRSINWKSSMGRRDSMGRSTRDTMGRSRRESMGRTSRRDSMGRGCRRGSMTGGTTGRRDSMGGQNRRGSMTGGGGRRDSMGQNRRGSMNNAHNQNSRSPMGRNRRSSMGNTTCEPSSLGKETVPRRQRRSSMSATGVTTAGGEGPSEEDLGYGNSVSPKPRPRMRRNLSISMAQRRSSLTGANSSGGGQGGSELDNQSVHSRGEISSQIEHQRRCRRSFRRSVSNCSASSFDDSFSSRMSLRRSNSNVSAVSFDGDHDDDNDTVSRGNQSSSLLDHQQVAPVSA